MKIPDGTRIVLFESPDPIRPALSALLKSYGGQSVRQPQKTTAEVKPARPLAHLKPLSDLLNERKKHLRAKAVTGAKPTKARHHA